MGELEGDGDGSVGVVEGELLGEVFMVGTGLGRLRLGFAGMLLEDMSGATILMLGI